MAAGLAVAGGLAEALHSIGICDAQLARLGCL
jgi:hypothetical protein